MNNKKLWRLCCIVFGIFTILTFTPIITPAGVYEPMVFGMPYTLWAGILQAFLLIGLTWVGTRVHPGNQN